MPHLNGTEASKDIRALILEDNRADAELMENELKNNGIVFRSKIVEDRKSYIKAIREFRPDIILSDYDLPAFSGAEALTLKKKLSPETPFILVTGAVGEERAIQLLTGGATDYVLKRNLSRLLPAVTRALHESYEHRKRKEAEAERDILIKELEKRVQERTQALQNEIEERKRTEEELREREKELAEAQRVSKVGSWIIDTCNDQFRWSDEIYRIFEVDRIEIGDQFGAFLNMVHPEDLSLVQNANAKIRASGEPFELECRIITPSGAFKNTRIIGYASKDNKGNIVRLFGTAQDITELKQAENRLRESEERFRALVGATSESFYCFNPDFSELRELYTRGFLADTGTPSRTWMQDYIYPDDHKILIPVLQEAIRKKSFLEVVVRIWRADGSLGWLISRAVPVLDANSNIIEWFGAISDITDRKQAEEALKESEEKYRLIFQSSLNGILIMRPDGSIIAANPAAQRILVMSKEEIIRKGRDGIADQSDPRLQTGIQDTFRTGKFFGELNWKKKGGMIFPVEISAVTFRNERREAFTSIIFSDISWRKNAERKIKESEQLFREMADTIPQLIITRSSDGINDYVNRMHEEFPGIIRKSDGSWEWRPAIHPDDLSNVLEARRRADEKKTYFEVEHRLKNSRGIYRWHITRGIPVRNESGHVIKWIATATDIHDLKEAEKKLKERTSLLEEANKELESFSYSVSHDLRAPLRAITGFSTLLKKKISSKLDKDEIRQLDIILDSAMKMDQLITDLLQFSRISRTEVSITSIDMNKLARDSWQEQLNANPERKLSFKIGPLPDASGDRNLIRQVFSNLLANAVKFSKKKKSSIIEIGGNQDGNEKVYYIRDNGSGFDMRYYDKLFGVFQRLHPECDYEGTGVGLAIVQRIIHRHGGRAWAEGKVGKGAIFFFSLPTK
jgi:PAS domain S-box-containing protein